MSRIPGRFVLPSCRPSSQNIFVGKAPSAIRTIVLAVHLDNGGNRGGRFAMTWEIDWKHDGNTGTEIWARNINSRIKSARVWHFARTDTLRKCGVNTPIYRSDSWEIDWGKRDIQNKRVWARNINSKMPSAKDWHWIDQHTVERAGFKWKPANAHSGRGFDSHGYVRLTKMGMTPEEIDLAEMHNLFLGGRKLAVHEHRLVALKKYGSLPPNSVVRHINGVKTDNRPENLLLGTTQENTMDHNTARLMAMYWRDKYEQSNNEVQRLVSLLDSYRSAVRRER